MPISANQASLLKRIHQSQDARVDYTDAAVPEITFNVAGLEKFIEELGAFKHMTQLATIDQQNQQLRLLDIELTDKRNRDHQEMMAKEFAEQSEARVEDGKHREFVKGYMKEAVDFQRQQYNAFEAIIEELRTMNNLKRG